MKTTVDLYSFRDAFRQMGRQDNFSHEGLRVLFDTLEEYEESTGQEQELDVIALCCDFSEDTWKDIADNYSIDLSDCADDDERADAVEEYLSENTWLCGRVEGTDGPSFVYQNF